MAETITPEPVIIEPEDQLYRRLNPDQIHDDGTVSRAAFINRGSDVSVNIAKLTSIEKTMAGYENQGLTSLRAADVRAKELEVVHDPCPEHEPDNFAHALITGKITKGIARALASCSTVIRFASVE